MITEIKRKKHRVTKVKSKNVPVKYYGDLLDNKNACMSYDYLVINYQGVPDFENLPDSVKVDFAPYGTKIMKKVANVSIDDRKFCSMVFEPRNKKIGEFLVQIKIENYLFYTISKKELKNLIQGFAKKLRLGFAGISRLDVALDFQNVGSELNQLIKGINTGDILISGRPKELRFDTLPISFNGRTKKGQLTYNSMNLGKRTSAKFLRMYDKTLEMIEVKYKSYIVDYWKRNGVENDNTWRLEYSMNSKYLKSLKIGLDEVFAENSEINILKTCFTNHFTVRYNTGKKEINKEIEIELFSWDKIAKAMTFIIEKLTELPNTILKSVRVAKRQVKGLYRNYYSSSVESFNDSMKHILKSYNINGWFEEKKYDYICEFDKETLILNKL